MDDGWYPIGQDNMSSLTTEEFDFIKICHGLQYTSHVPSFPGDNKFKGTQIHSSEYREWTPFVDKTVLVYIYIYTVLARVLPQGSSKPPSPTLAEHVRFSHILRC